MLGTEILLSLAYFYLLIAVSSKKMNFFCELACLNELFEAHYFNIIEMLPIYKIKIESLPLKSWLIVPMNIFWAPNFKRWMSWSAKLSYRTYNSYGLCLSVSLLQYYCAMVMISSLIFNYFSMIPFLSRLLGSCLHKANTALA